MIASTENNHQVCILQHLVVPDPVLIQVVSVQDSDANLPQTGQDGQGVDISPGPVSQQMFQIGSK